MTRGRGKKTPAPPPLSSVITGDGFDNPDDLSRQELQALSITSLPDLPSLLTRSGWTAGAMGAVSLTLSPDNSRVLHGSFSMVGELCQNKKFNANLFWPVETPTSLYVSLTDLSVFVFPNGSMTSNPLPSSAFEYSFSQNRVDLQEADLEEQGFSDFSIRAYVTPIEEFWVKCVLTLSPNPIESNTRLQSDPRYPGIKLHGFQFGLAPAYSSPPVNRSWGCPILPAIFPGTPWTDDCAMPSGMLLRVAMASVLRSSLHPEAKRSLPSYTPRCAELLTKGETALTATAPSLCWPLPSSLPPISIVTPGWFMTTYFSSACQFSCYL